MLSFIEISPLVSEKKIFEGFFMTGHDLYIYTL